MEFDNKNNKYKSVYITLNLSAFANRKLSESSKRSHRKKLQEAKLRLEDHLHRFRSISEINHTISQNLKEEVNDSNNQ